MKKTLAIFVLALFIVSMIPAALAEGTAPSDDASDATEDAAPEDAADNAEDAPLLERARGRMREAKEKKDELKARAEDAKERVLENKERLAAAKDELLEKHQARVELLVGKCRETGKTEEECKALFEKRLANIAELAPKFREKLQQFTEKRQERASALKELREDTILGKIERARNFRARAIEQAKVMRAQENLVFAKEKFTKAKAGLEKARLRLENAKAARVCRDNPESEECVKAREELREASKEKLAKQADIIISSLEKAKEKADSSEYLSNEEAANAIAFLDEQINKFNEIKAEIEAAATKEEIIAAAKKLAGAWKEVKQKVNAHLHFVANSRMAGVVVKAEHLAAKLERVLERMAENEKDTTSVEPLVADFRAKLGLAKEKFKAAHSLLLEVRAKEPAEEDKAGKVQEAQKLLKEAKGLLQEANQLLRQIFLELKNANALPELAEATEAEDVEVEAELSEAEEAEPAEETEGSGGAA